jgi:phosphohistidine phosphatase
VRRFVVVRHAKAQRSSPRGDHGRELSERGRDQALGLREWADRNRGPLEGVRGTVVVSDAARTLETFELGLAGTPVCRRAVVDPWLYNGVRDVSTGDVLAAVAAADPGEGDLLFVGHNPTVAYLVADLVADARVADAALRDGFPLCGAAVLAFDGPSLAPGSCVLEVLEAPIPSA